VHPASLRETAGRQRKCVPGELCLVPAFESVYLFIPTYLLIDACTYIYLFIPSISIHTISYLLINACTYIYLFIPSDTC
jgi:hypothetical protein